MASRLEMIAAHSMVLRARTAEDVMSPNPISIRDTATIREAIELLSDRNFSAAPVIDEPGRPVGVVSEGDILIHLREAPTHVPTTPEYYTRSHLAGRTHGKFPEGFEVEDVDPTIVRDVMTPVVFSVRPDAPIHQVVKDMLTLNVHRLFVVDADGALIGVISTFDILRCLER